MKVRFAFFAEHATMAGPWTVHAQNAGWVELQAAELPARVHLPLCLQLELEHEELRTGGYVNLRFVDPDGYVLIDGEVLVDLGSAPPPASLEGIFVVTMNSTVPVAFRRPGVHRLVVDGVDPPYEMTFFVRAV